MVFFWLLELYCIVCKLFETTSMIRSNGGMLFQLLRKRYFQKGYRNTI